MCFLQFVSSDFFSFSASIVLTYTKGQFFRASFGKNPRFHSTLKDEIFLIKKYQWDSFNRHKSCLKEHSIVKNIQSPFATSVEVLSQTLSFIT